LQRQALLTNEQLGLTSIRRCARGWLRQRRLVVFRLTSERRLKQRWTSAATASAITDSACCLTFELRGRSRNGAWPARRTIDQSASRAKCQAGGGPRSSEGLGRTLRGCGRGLVWVEPPAGCLRPAAMAPASRATHLRARCSAIASGFSSDHSRNSLLARSSETQTIDGGPPPCN